MGILYIRPLHFPNKEKSFCTKPIFLFKSNTMLQKNILNVDDLFCTLDTLVGEHVVAVMLQTKERQITPKIVTVRLNTPARGKLAHLLTPSNWTIVYLD